MASAQTWLELLAWIKTLFEATKATIDLTTTYQKYRSDPETIREAQRVSVQFSTYSQDEIDALLARVESCRRLFIAEGNGANRARCICSVLKSAMEGDGGEVPLIDGWRSMYRKLGCADLDRRKPH